MPPEDTEALELARALIRQLERSEWSDAASTAWEISYLASQEILPPPPMTPKERAWIDKQLGRPPSHKEDAPGEEA